MSLEEFRATLDGACPPEGCGLALQALWWEAKGDWNRAHELCQAAQCPEGDWVHAHLHRVEGDLGNAAYWYGRAGQPVCRDALEKEWSGLVSRLLAGCP